MFGIFKKNKGLEVKAPLTGKVVDLTDVPDEVFSKKMVGDGVAIKPSEGKLVAPVAGTIKQVFPTKHAIGIETEEGVEILIHIGINTVELKGEGFEALISEGDQVKVGDQLLNFDLDYIKENASSTITPILITNMDDIKGLEVVATDKVVAENDEILKINLD